ncbi:RCC1/BLIP-II [Russula earlei]|uniref:RCC1/BLIP-II n=1 Tax=Russula earlei TaxID=71964 RepID=A0ACC0UCK7_9AGAM|nr:RCC1/BLIP-II [Russula earlei]
MLRRQTNAALNSRRWFSHRSSPRGSSYALTRTVAVATSLAAVAAATIGQKSIEGPIHNEIPLPSVPDAGASRTNDAGTATTKLRADDGDELRLLVWGSNRARIVSPDASDAAQIRTPAVASFLQDVALRDLAVHATHAACVDGRGDVYQWGDGFLGQHPASGNRKPALTLRGKNVVSVRVTESRVFALSASGRVYVISAEAAQQSLPSMRSSSSTSRWGTSWLWSDDVGIQYSEIVPAQKLAWGERIISIAAGRDHLLALTTFGRTFAHPITKNANSHGQLGFRKFDIPDPSLTSSSAVTRFHVELTPRAVVDPYARSSRYARESPSSASPVSENLVNVDDTNLKFSDKFFEVPALRGVNVVQIAAAARSSFVRTDTGRVLGWGANEYGQIGLGGNVTLDTITVPTEVVLWRGTPNGTRTHCIDLNAGGDLAFFTVERIDGTSIRNVEVLSCGNGQYGGLGNALFTNSQSVPVRTRAVSGLLEFSEKTNNLQPIAPHALSVSPDGHVLLALETHAQAGPGGGGRDLLAWGTNYDFQVGNGKRASIAVPTVLETADGDRIMLGKRLAKVVRDAQGRVWRRGVRGYGTSLVYWRIA